MGGARDAMQRVDRAYEGREAMTAGCGPGLDPRPEMAEPPTMEREPPPNEIQDALDEQAGVIQLLSEGFKLLEGQLEPALRNGEDGGGRDVVAPPYESSIARQIGERSLSIQVLASRLGALMGRLAL